MRLSGAQKLHLPGGTGVPPVCSTAYASAIRPPHGRPFRQARGPELVEEDAHAPWPSFLTCTFRNAVLGIFLFSLASCSSVPSGPTGIQDYSTAYLGPHGEILYMSTPGARHKHKPELLKPAPEPEWSWYGDDIRGAPSIKISIASQRATFYKDGIEVGHTQISTGREGYTTPTGSFSVIEKSQEHLSTLYGDYVDKAGEVVVSNVNAQTDKRPPGAHFEGAPMPYFLRVTGPVGLHAGYLPGFPASHGCIRLPQAAALKFYENAKVGTPVHIVP